MAVLRVPIGSSAVALTVSGLAVVILLPLHPSILDRPVAEVVRETELWQPLHVSSLVMFALAFFGAAGLVAVHGNRLRRLGRVGLVLTFVGAIGGAGLSATEALVFPVLADTSPELLDLQGPLFTSWVFICVGLMSLGWALGLAIIGVAAARAAVFPRTAGVLLAVGGPAFIFLAGPFIPVAGIISGVLFGGTQIWWGWLMWKSRADRVSGSPG